MITLRETLFPNRELGRCICFHTVDQWTGAVSLYSIPFDFFGDGGDDDVNSSNPDVEGLAPFYKSFDLPTWSTLSSFGKLEPDEPRFFCPLVPLDDNHLCFLWERQLGYFGTELPLVHCNKIRVSFYEDAQGESTFDAVVVASRSHVLLGRDEIISGAHKVSDVIRPGMQGWDVNKLREVISEEEVNAIVKIALPSNPRRDRLIWHFNSQEVLEHNDVPPSANPAWRKPIPGSLKINCDVAIPLGSEKGTAAMVVRNEVGELVDGSTATFPVSSVLQGELEAIRRACYMVEGLKVSPVMIESDSRRAIELSVSELVPPWEVFEVVMDIRKMI
ncbi:hypothetical protein C3L33_02247, partial [Rhododendron williamsianum]